MDYLSAYTLSQHPVFATVFLAASLNSSTILGVLILFLLILSFIISGSEVALFSLSFKDINVLKTKQGNPWKRIVSLLEEPKILQGSLMIANTVINISIIILANFLIDQLMVVKNNLWGVQFIVKIVSVTFILLFFGEVMPKIWAAQNNFQFLYITSGVVEVVYYLFRRISLWMVGLSDKIERLLGGGGPASYNIDDLTNQSDATEEEKNIIKGIAKFGNITVKQIMQTRLDVSGVDYNLNFAGLKQKIEELHYSRLPVFKKNLDEIAGMVHTKDVLPYLTEADTFDWHKLMRAPYFVHEQKLIEDLLKEFQSKRIHFAIVVDEFGGTSGIVTMEDILEEIIGDIKDEFDDEESGNKKIDDSTYIFEGRTMINDVCKVMDLPQDTFDDVRGDSDSLAGLILELGGYIPQANDVISCGDFEFTVLEANRNRINKVKVAIKPMVQ
ncbi:MAG TPA: gliding motility-associated protein GldE [Chitinophagaceae bacterium]|nr:gliding motility-associated protein GldE [Chitinophagaceae bacterium]